MSANVGKDVSLGENWGSGRYYCLWSQALTVTLTTFVYSVPREITMFVSRQFLLLTLAGPVQNFERTATRKGGILSDFEEDNDKRTGN